VKSTIFWDITPCTPLKVNGRFRETCRLHLQGRRKQVANRCHLLSCWFLAQLNFSTLKMEAICSSKTSVDTRWSTQRYIPTTSNPTPSNLATVTAQALLVISGISLFYIRVYKDSIQIYILPRNHMHQLVTEEIYAFKVRFQRTIFCCYKVLLSIQY
jgi:hypothetical protein